MTSRLVLLTLLLLLSLSAQGCWDNDLEDRENIEECRKLAEQGDPEAQANLGSMYYSGAEVPRNHKKAMMWYKKSAAQNWMGASASHFYVGLMYNRGVGIPRDYKLAIKWYTQAAEMGDKAAQQALGAMYGNGKSHPKDNLLAHMWFSISIENGSRSAKKYRDRVAKKLTDSDLEKSKILVDQWVSAHP